jgi:hypothetical protein
VHELGRVDVTRDDAAPGELVHRRVARVVRAAHAREENEAARKIGEGPQDPLLVRQAVGGPAEGIGLAEDLGEEWVRKLS